jgi:outer membrane immunogenic protein
MQRNLLASTALTAAAALVPGAALAADLPLKARPPVAVTAFSWSGCYAGLNAGGVSANLDHDLTVPTFATFSSDGRDTGFIGGGQVGCNWQYAPNWVFGIEGDINYAHAARSSTFAFNFSGEDTVGSQNTSLRWLSTVRGRMGYSWDRSFLYATGGLAIGGVKSSVVATVSSPGTYAGSYSDTRFGWVVGGGFEHAFTDRLSAKLEYLHFDLGSASYNVNLVSGDSSGMPTTWPASAKVSGDIFRVGVNYKLN